jgi:hypothetical protein
MTPQTKLAWQRNHRLLFREFYGYSETSHYGTGKMRGVILSRDGFRCVQCGMTDGEHKGKWGRPITIDHKDKNRKNNALENLQTLCLSCHGRKDLLPSLRVPRVPAFKEEILSRRSNGETYQKIADNFGFSVYGIYRWVQIWEKEI